MAGFRGKVLLALVLFPGTTSTAHAWLDWHGSYYGPTVYYPAYSAPAYYYYPLYPACSTTPASAPRPTPPAPRGASKEPAVMGDKTKKGPTITESRSKSNAQAAGGSTTERCKVGFWNLTGRDVTLKVDGRQQYLPKDRAVTLDLGRSFTWQIDQREPVTERVSEEQPFHEVILRQ